MLVAVVPINNPLNLTERLDPLDGPPQRLLLVLDQADGGAGQQVRDQDAEVAAARAEVHDDGRPSGAQGVAWNATKAAAMKSQLAFTLPDW